MKTLILKRPQTRTMPTLCNAHTQHPFLISQGVWQGNCSQFYTHTHTHTHEISKVKKRKSGQKIGRREEVLDTRAAAEVVAHFCVSDIHLPLNVYLFFFSKGYGSIDQNSEVSERVSFCTALKSFPYGYRKTGHSLTHKRKMRARVTVWRRIFRFCNFLWKNIRIYLE